MFIAPCFVAFPPITEGRLQCLGTPQHLKNKYAAGYRVEIHTRDTESHVSDVIQFISALHPRAQFLEGYSGKLTFQLPASRECPPLSKIFGGIEEASKGLGIFDYSVSQTSLEQVFIMMAQRGLKRKEGVPIK